MGKGKDGVNQKGDAVCQQLEADLMATLSALKQQGELTLAIKKQREKDAKALRKLHEKTAVYIKWKKAISEEYSEKIKAFKEDLEEQYRLEKQAKLADYDIFMAIAEDIGYDATGRDTGNNELDLIGAELRRFIEAEEKGDSSFFV